ncbi:hypothetical protein AB0D08_00560 [Kitasatospora sp. NPDC048540]|uniref:hypothetical protein n=1 Tax=Kitasatospora sp. NPDC048540 TaxID=3155634 RepID=UPI0033F10E88
MSARQLTVRLDAEMSADLKTLMEPGINQTEAVRRALATLAAAHRGAWMHGYVADGAAVQVTAFRVIEHGTEVESEGLEAAA